MIQSQVVADSINQQGDRITTILCTYPRIIHSEVMTHRMLSKNSASSRAIPFNKMVKSVEDNPFIPIAWQKQHSGMQGTEYENKQWRLDQLNDEWLNARNKAIDCAINLGDDVTKQIRNRLLEPFMYHTVLITGTDDGWNNFFSLRCPQYTDCGMIFKSKIDYLKKISTFQEYTHLEWLQINKGQSEIHIMALAESIWDSMNESKPKLLQSGEYHIPFKNKIDTEKCKKILLKQLTEKGEIYDTLEENKWIEEINKIKIKVASGFAARTSYTVINDEKEISYETLINIHDKCFEQNHWSVFEHCAKVMSNDEYNSFIKGNIHDFADKSLQKEIKESYGKTFIIGEVTDEKLGWCNNLKGFIQYRYMLENK